VTWKNQAGNVMKAGAWWRGRHNIRLYERKPTYSMLLKAYSVSLQRESYLKAIAIC